MYLTKQSNVQGLNLNQTILKSIKLQYNFNYVNTFDIILKYN